MYVIKDDEPKTFEFRRGDNEYALPLIDCLPVSEVKEISDVGDSALVDVIERYAPGSLDGITGAQLKGLMRAWGEESRAKMGES